MSTTRIIAPAWFLAAKQEEGFHEFGNNQGIDKYIKLAKCGQKGDPWCSIFCCAMLESVGVRSPRNAMARSFEHDRNFTRLTGPALGAVAVFWRGSRGAGTGHVGFYAGENATHVWVLGGNENDAVRTAPFPKNSARIGLLGYWWPLAETLPIIGLIRVFDGKVPHVETSAV